MRRVLALLFAAAILTLAPPRDAQAEQYPYCVTNRTTVTIDFKAGARQREALPPGRRSCCTGSRCPQSVDIGVYDREFERAMNNPSGHRQVLRAMRHARGLGNPIMRDHFTVFCNVQAQYDDRIEIWADGDGFRCDVGNADSHTQYVAGRHGERLTGRIPMGRIEICNNAADGPAWSAIAYWTGDTFRSEGWFEVSSGACVDLDLVRGYRGFAYVYAETRNYEWTGPPEETFCVDAREGFDLRDADIVACDHGRYERRAFTPVPVVGSGRYVIR
jgi:uncharacterized membrane protein